MLSKDGRYTVYFIQMMFEGKDWGVVDLAYYPVAGEHGAFKNLDRDFYIMRHGSESIAKDYSTSVFQVLSIPMGSFDKEVGKRCLEKLKEIYKDKSFRLIKRELSQFTTIEEI